MRGAVLLAGLFLKVGRFLHGVLGGLADAGELTDGGFHHLFHRLGGLVGGGTDGFAEELGILLHLGNGFLHGLLHVGLVLAGLFLQGGDMDGGSLHGVGERANLRDGGFDDAFDRFGGLADGDFHGFADDLAGVLMELGEGLLNACVYERLLRLGDFLQCAHLIGGLLQRAGERFQAGAGGLAEFGQRLGTAFVEGGDGLGELFLDGLIVFLGALFQRLRLFTDQL